MTKNFVIFASGRGASYAFMITCDESEVTSKCRNTLTSGFECYIYTIEPSPLGQPGFVPQGAMALRRVWHLYNAHDEFKQEAVDLVERLSAHSVEASREYLSDMMEVFRQELVKLKIEQAQPTTGA